MGLFTKHNLLTEDQASAAAKWWRDRLERPTFDNLGKTRWHPSERGAAMAEMMAMMLAKPQKQQRLDAFEAALKAKLLSFKEGDYFHYLGVDYGPDRILSEAADAAGITNDGLTTFPWKTSMWFDLKAGTITAAIGYGGERRQVWPAAAPRETGKE